MTAELAGLRLLAPYLGASLYTWTGVIGVMLAATAGGNWVGGRLADSPRNYLGLSLAVAALGVFAIFVNLPILTAYLDPRHTPLGVFPVTLIWTFALFAVPMFWLGTVSPQVIRLSVPDVAHAGRTAGRVYAVSTLGAVAGTFATGHVLISQFGVIRVFLGVGLAVGLLGFAAGRFYKSRLGLLTAGLAAGVAVVGVPMVGQISARFDRETDYFAIRVEDSLRDGALYRTLYLDRLAHSTVRLGVPGHLDYAHEHVQVDLTRLLLDSEPEVDVLVIGGGGYTFPRYLETQLPEVGVEVVEIDPGVTAVAREKLGLPEDTAIGIHHMDGRRFIDEFARPGRYELIVLDAVNDFSVPHHLLTEEFNRAVRRALAPRGVYLVSVIDSLGHGRLWRAVVHTLRREFPHVHVLAPAGIFGRPDRNVYVIYASGREFCAGDLRSALQRQIVTGRTEALDEGTLSALLRRSPAVVLSDQYAPVDNLLWEVYRAAARR